MPDSAEPSASPPPPGALRRWAVNLLRISVSVVVLAWVFSKVPLQDQPRLAVEMAAPSAARYEGDLVQDDGTAVVLRGEDRRDITLAPGQIRSRHPLPPRPGVITIASTASVGGLAAFFALYIVPLALTAYRWMLLVRDQGIAMPFGTALRLTLVGTFFNNFLLGSTGGDVVKAAVAGAGTGRTARVLSTVLLDRVIGLAAVALIGSAALLVGLPLAPPAMRDRLAMPALFVCGAVLAFVVGYLFYYSRRVRASAAVQWIKNHLPMREVIREMDAVFQEYRRKPRLAAATLAVTFVSQVAFILMAWMGGRSLGIAEAAWWHYFVMIPIIQVVTALPISVAGWGVGEGAYKELFALVGADPARAVALSLMSKLVAIAYGLPGGVFFALGRRRKTG